ncbi:MAG: adenylate/guanylate cyclase domain-containing protein, partial [Chloroflexia bacterium]
MDKLPSGTITFLFTDIEGSTKRWEEQPAAMGIALAKHDILLRGIFEGCGGYVFKTIGDAFCVAFARATEAITASMESQRALYRQEWGVAGGIRVRMAIHTGMTEERDGDYFGPAVNRVARLLSAGHGGQILLSLTTEELVNGTLPAGARLEDMGEHSLKDLQRSEHIFQLHVEDLPANTTPLKTLNNRPHNLPLQNTAFIGREPQVQHLKVQLLRADVRLLTLTGLGGTGKTRLSLRIGADLIDDFTDGVFFVPLANEQEPVSVMSVIAQTLGVAETDGRTLLDSLKDALKAQQMLLILDNFEQVLGAAKLIATLISSCPKIKLLVTSRAALRVYGEKEYVVPPMSLPSGRRKASLDDLMANESVQLFLNRAQAVKPEFELTTQNAATVTQICSKLDGLPLALELAAARIRLLTPQAMLTRLESRLKILTGGAKDLPARQQTLRGAIDWSYDLLNETDRALFRRLAVFVGGCTLEAMESVCMIDGDVEIDVLNETESLVSKSLLRQETQDDGEPRFAMLETVREYALEKLAESGEAEEIQGRHVGYYLAFSEDAEPKLLGAQQATWLNLLESEHDNMRAALSWALENNRVEEALRLAGALSRFWVLRSYFTEGRRRLAEALAVTEPHNVGSYDMVMSGVGDSEEDVRGYIQESLEALNRVLAMSYPDMLTESAMQARAKALNGAGNLSHRQGDYIEARRL